MPDNLICIPTVKVQLILYIYIKNEKEVESRHHTLLYNTNQSCYGIF